MITYIALVCDGASANIKLAGNLNKDIILCTAHGLHIAVHNFLKKAVTNLKETHQIQPILSKNE